MVVLVCLWVHGRASGGSLVREFTCPWFGVSLVRRFTCPGFTCPGFSSTMTFLAEIEAVLMKTILYRFGVATPRAMLKYTWAMLFCWSIVAKFLPRFPLHFSFC